MATAAEPVAFSSPMEGSFGSPASSPLAASPLATGMCEVPQALVHKLSPEDLAAVRRTTDEVNAVLRAAMAQVAAIHAKSMLELYERMLKRFGQEPFPSPQTPSEDVSRKSLRAESLQKSVTGVMDITDDHDEEEYRGSGCEDEYEADWSKAGVSRSPSRGGSRPSSEVGSPAKPARTRQRSKDSRRGPVAHKAFQVPDLDFAKIASTSELCKAELHSGSAAEGALPQEGGTAQELQRGIDAAQQPPAKEVQFDAAQQPPAEEVRPSGADANWRASKPSVGSWFVRPVHQEEIDSLMAEAEQVDLPPAAWGGKAVPMSHRSVGPAAGNAEAANTALAAAISPGAATQDQLAKVDPRDIPENGKTADVGPSSPTSPDATSIAWLAKDDLGDSPESSKAADGKPSSHSSRGTTFVDRPAEAAAGRPPSLSTADAVSEDRLAQAELGDGPESGKAAECKPSSPSSLGATSGVRPTEADSRNSLETGKAADGKPSSIMPPVGNSGERPAEADLADGHESGKAAEGELSSVSSQAASRQAAATEEGSREEAKQDLPNYCALLRTEPLEGEPKERLEQAIDETLDWLEQPPQAKAGEIHGKHVDLEDAVRTIRKQPNFGDTAESGKGVDGRPSLPSHRGGSPESGRAEALSPDLTKVPVGDPRSPMTADLVDMDDSPRSAGGSDEALSPWASPPSKLTDPRSPESSPDDRFAKARDDWPKGGGEDDDGDESDGGHGPQAGGCAARSSGIRTFRVGEPSDATDGDGDGGGTGGLQPEPAAASMMETPSPGCVQMKTLGTVISAGGDATQLHVGRVRTGSDPLGAFAEGNAEAEDGMSRRRARSLELSCDGDDGEILQGRSNTYPELGAHDHS
mmetsp:Transcript_56605/g.183343  ORF Transcript_56605/g.183343 Transcript_56605/m.183343 type:complete len:865 (-) Transcript_56605:328-2922(-)